MNKRIVFSCVLDYSPLMAVQCYIWLSSLLENNVNSNQVYIHLVSEIPETFLEYLKEIDVNIISKTTFNKRNKYCNKLVQLDTFIALKNYDYVFLMDCDTAVVDINDIDLTDDVYAKVVDFPNPPLSILQNIFKENKLELIPTETTFSIKGEQITDWNNCNGGLYIIKKEFLKTLAEQWIHYANTCIEQEDIFTTIYSKHADQVGFALAVTSLNKQVTHLGVEWNYPTHVKSEINIQPKILHFHDCIDTQIKIKKVNLEKVDSVITTLNLRISQSIRKKHLNSIFWDFRYEFYPELGSGVGSRGKTLEYKRTLLQKCFDNKNDITVLDVGCGDLEIIKVFKFKKYLGVDLSMEAIKKGQIKKPEWSFKHISSADFYSENMDVVICLDVLIHQKSYDDYLSLINKLVKYTNKRLIIAAYDEDPSFNSDITFFYEPITETLNKTGDFKRVAKIGEYNSTAFVVADKNNSDFSKVQKLFQNTKSKKKSLLQKMKTILKKI